MKSANTNNTARLFHARGGSIDIAMADIDTISIFLTQNIGDIDIDIDIDTLYCSVL